MNRISATFSGGALPDRNTLFNNTPANQANDSLIFPPFAYTSHTH